MCEVDSSIRNGHDLELDVGRRTRTRAPRIPFWPMRRGCNRGVVKHRVSLGRNRKVVLDEDDGGASGAA